MPNVAAFKWDGLMAIEWYVSDADPVRYSAIVGRAQAVALALGCAGFDFGSAAVAASRRAVVEADGEFAATLVVVGGGRHSTVEVTAASSEDYEDRERRRTQQTRKARRPPRVGAPFSDSD